MIGWLVGFVVGVLVGAGGALLHARRRSRLQQAVIRDGMQVDVRAVIQGHAEAMQAQVRQFAEDLIAADGEKDGQLHVLDGKSVQ